MAFSPAYTSALTLLHHQNTHHNLIGIPPQRNRLVTNCESDDSSLSSSSSASPNSGKLEVGSPVVVVAVPKTIKTAASMPCLIVNSGIVKQGDVGRIVSRKPKDVWAVRLAIGTYLLDGKYFMPLAEEDGALSN